jgi:hypothetical protein
MTFSKFVRVTINTWKRTPYRASNMMETTFRVHAWGRTGWNCYERPSLFKKLHTKAVLRWEQTAARMRYSPSWNLKRRLSEPYFGKTSWEKPSRDHSPTKCPCGMCDGTQHLPEDWVEPGPKDSWADHSFSYSWEDRDYKPALATITEEEEVEEF